MPSADLLHRPTTALDGPQLLPFMRYCELQTDLNFPNYRAFESFSVEKFRAFWSLFLGWSEIIYEGDREPVCTSDNCETAVFFPEIRLNYAENVLNIAGKLIGCHADGSQDVIAPDALRSKVIKLANFLRQLEIKPGDIVAAIARNNVEVVITALATAAIGAVFSSCAHDMGTFTVLSRFQKLEPKVLVANYASRPWDIGKPLADRVSDVVAGLPSLTAIIALDDPRPSRLPMHAFDEIVGDDQWAWQRFPFNHPLFILFSSGTTGTPKCIMHGTGGTLLEHVKEHRLHGDLTSRDRMFFQTSCGWMMWNWQLSALACGADIVTYDGPLKGPETLWQIVADQQVTVFGTNPAYLQFTERAGYAPNGLDLSALRGILSTGSILHPKQFDWITERVKPIPIQSISGGTDILGCFVLGNPILPVCRGQAQCRSLGLDVRSLPSEGIGELVCANPFPSRPIGFYGESNERYHNAYFAQNPGVWTHGDLIEITPDGVTMHGRSDGVMNIRGVRIGPAEIYRILQQVPTIVEAMAVEQTDENEPGGSRLVLLVVLRSGVRLDTALISRIRTFLMDQGNAMMVPAAIIQMSELPVTHSGKRSEAAARDAVNGKAIGNRSALLNPECLDGLFVPPPPTIEITAIHGDYERNLCEICQRHLNIPTIQPSDDYLAMGGDSLVILGFLLEVAARTALPLHAMIEASTIKELVLLLTGASSLRVREGGPRVRPFVQHDVDEVCQLLSEGFRRKLPWHRMFDHQWQHEAIPRGFVLTANGEIVGFIGLICAARHLAGKSGLVCNLSSWYVRPAYRGWSNALMAAATQFEGITYTSLTPGPIARRILLAMGFSALDKETHYLPPILQVATLRGHIRLIFDPVEMRPMLSASWQRVLDDHRQYDCLPMLLLDGDEIALAVFRRRVIRRRFLRVPYSEVLYCSSDDLMDRYLERIKLGVMRRQGTVLLSAGKQSIPTSYGITVTGHNLYRSGTFAAHELDKLYSELALLPI